MSRETLTPELAEIIRTIRLQNKITSKDLANHINKSPAYITKMERGDFSTLDSTELYLVLKYITQAKDDDKTIKYLYKSLEHKYSNREIEEQLWFYNYDTTVRNIMISSELIDYINHCLEKNSISRDLLNYRINSNEALPPEDITDNSLPINRWYCKDRNKFKTFIKIYLPASQMNDILDKNCAFTPYIFVYCILFYSLKIKEYKNRKELSSEEYRNLIKETKDILYDYNFLSTTARNEYAHNNKKISTIVNNFDNNNSSCISNILEKFTIASNNDALKTDNQLKSFLDNLSWDLGFMLKLMSLNFRSLKFTSISNRKRLICEIDSLIAKYQSSDISDNIEDY